MNETRTKKILAEHAGLEGEILQEIAEALGNAGERLENALDKVMASKERIEELRMTRDDKSIKATDSSQERLKEEIHKYNVLREEALMHYRHLIIHREAVGFRNHKLVQEKYQIPPRVRLSEG